MARYIAYRATAVLGYTLPKDRISLKQGILSIHASCIESKLIHNTKLRNEDKDKAKDKCLGREVSWKCQYFVGGPWVVIEKKTERGEKDRDICTVVYGLASPWIALGSRRIPGGGRGISHTAQPRYSGIPSLRTGLA